MKRIALYLSTLVLVAVMLFSFSACTNNDGYSKTDVDALIMELQEALAKKSSETDLAIETLKSDYDAKISALEAENATIEGSIETLVAEYNAKIEELTDANTATDEALANLEKEYDDKIALLQADIAKNTAKISSLEEEMNAEIEELREEYEQKMSNVTSLISALQSANLSNAERISILESQISEILSAHQHRCGAWVDYSGNGDINCEDRLFYRICAVCNQLEWKKGSKDTHAYGGEYFCDDYLHWQLCTK